MPSECYFFKIQTVEKPSRTILDEIKKTWYEECGVPLDNDGGERQARFALLFPLSLIAEIYCAVVTLLQTHCTKFYTLQFDVRDCNSARSALTIRRVTGAVGGRYQRSETGGAFCGGGEGAP